MHSTWFISTVFVVVLVAAADADADAAAVAWSGNGSGSWLGCASPFLPACLGTKLQQVERASQLQLQILYFLFRFWVLFFCISWPKQLQQQQQLTLSSNMRFMRQFVKRKWLLPRIIIVHHGGRNAIQSRQPGSLAAPAALPKLPQAASGVKVKCLLEPIRLHFCLYYVYAQSTRMRHKKQIEFFSFVVGFFLYLYFLIPCLHLKLVS